MFDYLLVFYAEGEIYELELTRGDAVTIGSGEDDSLSIAGFGLASAHLTVSSTESGIHVASVAPMQIRGEQTTNRMLSVGDIARVAEVLSMSVFEKRCDLEGAISVAGQKEIRLGRSERNDICLISPQVSSKHAVIRAHGGAWILEDLGSTNRTFVNGEAVKSAQLKDNSSVFIGGWEFIFRKNALYFNNTAGSVKLSPKLKFTNLAAGSPKGTPYPYFQRSPRLKPEAETMEADILPPPNRGAKPSVSWLSVLLPPAMMILVMVSVSFLMKNRTMLYYTVPMSSVSIFISIVNHKSQMKKWNETQRLAREKYDEHLKSMDAIITDAETRFLHALDAVNPSVYECVGIAGRISRRLWERAVTDGDFLEVRLGSSRTRSNVNVKIPKPQLAIEEDPLLKEAQSLREKHATLTGVPATHSFMSSTITGLAGSRSAIKKTAWTIVMGVAAHHSYEDVKLVCVYPESERGEWEWMRWLPHVWNPDRSERYIACASEDARPLLREMGDLLKSRRRSASNERKGVETPIFFLLLADKSLVEDSGEQILPESPQFGVTVVYAYGDIGLLPGECQAIVNCDDAACSLQLKSSAASRVSFAPERISRSLADEFARSLAPVRLRSSAATASMPDYITFLQGYEANRVEDLDVMGRWLSSAPFKSIAAPLGVRENGETFYFDIHEKGMGPHGIVAGATRWGKSETLTTWLLSVALNFHPHEVSFVLIDFKGDGLSGILMDLPHVAGVISNVDDITSIERNLRSLHGELIRRQLVFKETKLENIHKYQEAYRSGRAPAPMPYLIIVIDEFAELKTQFPDQMNEFISIARVGGSLGVYMVLATQSPGGIVAGQVSANSRFRICLKTAESGESKEILGAADAFKITTRGRAIVKVGNNEVYEHVQTFYSKAAYQPASGHKGPATKINIVEANGRRVRPEVYDKTADAARGDLSEGRAVSNFIRETAEKNNIPNTRRVWTEALPKQLFLSDLIGGREAFQNGAWQERDDGLSVVAGLVDDPEGQRQYPLVLDFIQDGHHIIYGAPSSGKTAFLQTALLSAASLYTPDQVQFVVLDFGSWGMKIFEGLPHTLLIADANDAEKVKQAEEYLAGELASRKRRFAEQGVGVLGAYREITGERVPALLIVIDNMASLHGMYPDMLDHLIDVAREGGGLGLYLMITAGSQGSFMYRIAQYVKASYALQLTDRADYRALVGGNGRVEPGHFPGRGLAKGPLEFQTALCVSGASEGERVKQLRAICSAMSDAWTGAKAALHPMSEHIDADSMPFDKDLAQIGFDKTTSAPFQFEFSRMNGCVISGPPGSGKTNALGLIVRALARDPGTAVYIYEKGDALKSLCDGRDKTSRDGAEADIMMTELGEEYDRRSDEGSDGAPRIAICIDNFVKFFEEVSDDGANILDVIIRCGEEYGVYVWITGDMAELTRFHNLAVKPLKNCLANGNAIALGGRLKDHSMFNSLHDENDAALQEYIGCVIHDRRASFVKLAKVGLAVAANA